MVAENEQTDKAFKVSTVSGEGKQIRDANSYSRQADGWVEVNTQAGIQLKLRHKKRCCQ